MLVTFWRIFSFATILKILNPISSWRLECELSILGWYIIYLYKYVCVCGCVCVQVAFSSSLWIVCVHIITRNTYFKHIPTSVYMCVCLRVCASPPPRRCKSYVCVYIYTYIWFTATRGWRRTHAQAHTHIYRCRNMFKICITCNYMHTYNSERRGKGDLHTHTPAHTYIFIQVYDIPSKNW